MRPSVRAFDRSIARRIAFGLTTAAFLVFGVGGWAATSELSGAVIAPSRVVVDGNTKKVQHPKGGIVGEILMRDGARVDAGQVLLRLDDTQTRASLGIVSAQLLELEGRMARLVAERDGGEEILFPAHLREASAEARRVMAGEQLLFDQNRAAREAQTSQLEERIGQLEREIEGLEAQKAAKNSEIALVAEEVKRVAKLFEQELIPITRLLAMKRESIRIRGERGTLIANIAQARGRIAETRLQIGEIDQRTRMEAQDQIRNIEARVAELRERKVVAEDDLRRIEIRAPQRGIVHDLAVHTVGGVIDAAETLMLIVPTEDRLIIEARVAPADIDQVHVGQPARLRFAAFNQRTTPEVHGEVSRVSADLITDAQTNTQFYRVRITVSDEEIARLGSISLVAGMPVEAFIQTEPRTALAYLVKPFTDQLARAFREE